MKIDIIELSRLLEQVEGSVGSDRILNAELHVAINPYRRDFGEGSLKLSAVPGKVVESYRFGDGPKSWGTFHASDLTGDLDALQRCIQKVAPECNAMDISVRPHAVSAVLIVEEGGAMRAAAAGMAGTITRALLGALLRYLIMKEDNDVAV